MVSSHAGFQIEWFVFKLGLRSLCCALGQDGKTVTAPVSTQVYKWIPGTLSSVYPFLADVSIIGQYPML